MVYLGSAISLRWVLALDLLLIAQSWVVFFNSTCAEIINYLSALNNSSMLNPPICFVFLAFEAFKLFTKRIAQAVIRTSFSKLLLYETFTILPMWGSPITVKAVTVLFSSSVLSGVLWFASSNVGQLFSS